MDEIFQNNKPYLIAETAYSFEGDSDYLLKQINELKNSNIDCIKFHMLLNEDEYVIEDYDELYNLLVNWKLKKDEWIKILENSKKNGLDTILLVDDINSVKFANNNKELVDGIEIHAACVNDIKLFNKAINFAKENDKVFLIGISGFEAQEISDIMEHLESKNLKKVVMMYGFQNFPTDLNNINLKKIKLYNELFQYEIGYADHTIYNNDIKEDLILSAYSLGAHIQEVHYILNEGEERTDYITGLNANNLIGLKNRLDKIHLGMGKIDFRLNDGEKEYLNFRKVPVYIKDLKKGTIIKDSHIVFKRVQKPKRQHKFKEIKEIYGSELSCDVKKDKELEIKDFN